MPKKRLTGEVTSTKMDKTIVIVVETKKKHKMYKKLVKVTKKFKARDDIGVSKGDTVVIEESVPYSKTVKWKVVEKRD